MHETAYAKINLALHVRGREPDGYHRIETLFAFCEDGDRLEILPSGEAGLQIDGPMASELAADADNIVSRAAGLLGAAGRAAALRLTKCLPVAAGLGGGSADAAATMRLLDRALDLGLGADRLAALAASLGADVPACIGSVTVRGEGRGDTLSAVPAAGLSGTPVLLVNPRKPVSTARVYAAWDGVDRGPLTDDWANGRNDLEPVARRMVPEIAEVVGALEDQPGARVARMSGSGASCFALFESEPTRDAARSAIATASPEWWQLATRLR